MSSCDINQIGGCATVHGEFDGIVVIMSSNVGWLVNIYTTCGIWGINQGVTFITMLRDIILMCLTIIIILIVRDTACSGARLTISFWDTYIRLASVRWNHAGRRPCIRHRSWWSCSSDGQGDKKEDVGNGRVTLWSALASSIDWSSFRSDDRAIDISGFKNQESCCTTRHRTSVWPALVAPSVSNGATYILQCFQERGSCLQQ